MIASCTKTYKQITANSIVARIEGITLNNLPFSNKYDHKTGVESGDLYSYQMDHLPIEGQIILAKHQLNKAKSDIRAWRRKDAENGLNVMIGINDKERYGVFKNAPVFVGAQMNAAIKVFEAIDPSIGIAWRQRNLQFNSSVAQIEHLYPSKVDCNKERMGALAPVLVTYLDDMTSCIETLLEYYRSQEELIE